ncbi:phosphate ABC transporter substrate-binding protein PstS [Corynebacterium kozikiae]|uniref:phosphate ABC transporter substrate-binding protein PstS n=1 Tax=Corynebacterium kozikiae TaxID=2968469 RepID=UPI00211C156B|nr:phosphate ABC transporter substrate-binding protein PstS [Corynebacterium sp. 76QC2CO]
MSRKILLASAVVASLVLAACSETSTSSSSSDATGASEVAANLTGATGSLVAEGASSQQNAMDFFNVQYQQAVSGASLAYTASGSGSGRKNFIGGQAVFAGSDSPLADDQVEPAAQRCGGNEAWHLPMVIGPVAIAYNLPGVDTLNLSTATVAKIFNGSITAWNAPEIAAENPDAELPETQISVIFRSDESGTSDNFQKFLVASTPENWDTTGQAFPATVGSGANGSNGVASEVKSIEGAITYVESGFAKQQSLGVANIDFGAGSVELNPESVGVALDNLAFKTEGHNMVVDTEALFASENEGAYPLVLTTYEIVCSAGYDENTRNQVKDFLTVALENQNDQLNELGYIPVTGQHLERLQAAVEAIS